MRLVADEGVDAPIVKRLREDGHVVTYIAEMAPSTADDEILALARAHEALLITADKDFGALVFQQRQVTAGVLLLRLAGMTAADKAKLVSGVVHDRGQQLTGAFTVLTPHRLRIRPS